VGFAEVVPPNCCHPFLLEALLFQWPYKGIVLLEHCLELKTPEANKSDEEMTPGDAPVRRAGDPALQMSRRREDDAPPRL
jgi:hypothetical protein